MNTQHITAELDRLQAVIQPADDALNQFSNLVSSHDGPLFDAIGLLTDELVRRVAEAIGCTHDLLQDWWLVHQFGHTPMTVIVGDRPEMQLRTNAELAEFMAEVLP